VNAPDGCTNLEDTVKFFREDPHVNASLIMALQATYEDVPWKSLGNPRYYLIVFQLIFTQKSQPNFLPTHKSVETA
jgi:hypothetical protein